LLRRGWSHGDDEIISQEQAIEWFTPKNIGKSAARFDMDKLMNLNAHYIRQKDNSALMDLIKPALEKELGHSLAAHERDRIVAGLGGLKERAKDLNDLAQSAMIYADIIPYDFDEKAKKFVGEDAKDILKSIRECLNAIAAWDEETVEADLRQLAENLGLKFGKIAQPLRAGLTGRAVSPGIFDVMAALGQKETLARLDFVIAL
jgi:glutamyl-tRNA synthetase